MSNFVECQYVNFYYRINYINGRFRARFSQYGDKATLLRVLGHRISGYRVICFMAYDKDHETLKAL